MTGSGTYVHTFPSATGTLVHATHDHDGGDGAQISHTTLSGIGTNTHAQIDSHISNTSNPHSVTTTQIGAMPTSGGTFTGNVAHDGFLVLNRTSATIATGAITADSSYMVLDTEGAAATDDLVTINGYALGRLLILQTANNTRDIVVKTTGNISLPLDRTLSNTQDKLILLGTSAGWVELVFSDVI